MKNKAFTLVELLGVIVLLGIIGVVIIPKVGDSITNSKETALITQEEQIKKAANDFIVDNSNLFDNTNTVTIKLGVLKQKGYIPINIKNPKTRKNISNESTIVITKNENKFEITLNLIDLVEVTENIDNNSPIIVLNGNYIEYVDVKSNETEINTKLIQNGAKAYSASGQEITEITTQIKIGETEKSNIKTNSLDTYTVTYTVTDNNKTTSSTRTVIIRDNEAPTITLPKETKLHVSEVGTFNLMDGVIINDNYSANTDITINVESSLSNVPGNYIITYTATDESRNQRIERRVINVNNDWSEYYTNLEYIQSTGTQYIDTGFIPNQDTKIETKFQTTDELNINQFLYGTRTSNFKKTFSLMNSYTTADSIRFDTNNTNTLRYAKNGIVHTTIQDKTTYYIDGENKGSIEYQNYVSPASIYIFAANTGGSASSNSYSRIFYLKIWDDDTPVRNFIPCYRNKDGEAGLYDLINNHFYTNQGEGEFIKGE